ncbi:peptidoglycan-binding protein [Streptomyces sp. NPDC087219]|uniref:peptidoglycan-binding domain-containing protein n=1 Tax=Streptomyces sp. NPDC087219 TaxID=3365770 RepID=UPI00380D56F3
MRNRAALTTAVIPIARETARPEHPTDRVFGKVAEPHRGGAGARGQDIELFDATVRLPKVPAHAATPSPGSRRSRPAHTAPPAWRSMSLPLMVAGALSAGLAGALTVWLSAGPEPTPPSHPSLALPGLATAATAPTTPSTGGLPPTGTHPSAGESAHVRVPRATPPPAPAAPAPSATPSRAAASTPSPAPTTTPPPPSSHQPHRPPRPTSRELALGSAGPEVADLQRRLQRLYLYLGSADGVFTEPVGEALSRFQIARNIPERPGVYGPLTRTALRAETD